MSTASKVSSNMRPSKERGAGTQANQRRGLYQGFFGAGVLSGIVRGDLGGQQVAGTAHGAD